MSTTACSSSSSNDIQFFVRTMSGNTLVLHANANDTIRSIHGKIHSATGVPLLRQRLVYGSKQLESDHTFFHYNITNDSTLHLVALMHSTRVYRGIHGLLNAIREAQRFESRLITKRIQKLVKDSLFSSLYPNVHDCSCLREALVKLYISPYYRNKNCARKLIEGCINSVKDECISPNMLFPKYREFAPIVLHFYKLLHAAVPHDDPLYIFCRTSLGSILRITNIIAVQDIIPFVNELAANLSRGLVSSMAGPSSTDVHEFNMFFRYTVNATIDSKALDQQDFGYSIYLNLFKKMKACLYRMENDINVKVKRDGGRDQYLSILRLLHYTSQLYEGEEETFWTNLRPHKVALCYLIVEYTKRSDIDDHKWILNYKDLIGFKTRRHLVMMLLPEVTQDDRNSHKMLISRSDLLAESFESITGANEDSLRGPIFIQFKNEEASGSGVLREWFMLVCQAIFNPQNALFLACPGDGRRFFPNPASKINPGHLEYYRFAGRMIALALMHKMQVGIAFARAFCKQLAGINVSLEHIEDVDPYLYNSCKQILDMDPCVVDQDVLGLTFTWEFEELGFKKVVELKKDGKQESVNSKNRKEYINLIITDRFVTSIADQLRHFSQGFVEIVGTEENMNLCFKILDLEYLDQILCGSECDISVDDWEAHTIYKGYKENDPQIHWFWQIVREMSVEQHQVLLFFWTSVKYVPVEGFRGLASKLYIIKSDEKYDRLPSSHTCFYQICIPAYPSMAVMQERLNIITREYVGCSFGTV